MIVYPKNMNTLFCCMTGFMNSRMNRPLSAPRTAVAVALLGCGVCAQAEPNVPAPSFDASHMIQQQQLEWSNHQPAQKQALDNFYRSLEQTQVQELSSQRLIREQQLQQLRGMSPQQRQQMFMDFVQQLPVPAAR